MWGQHNPARKKHKEKKHICLRVGSMDISGSDRLLINMDTGYLPSANRQYMYFLYCTYIYSNTVQ